MTIRLLISSFVLITMSLSCNSGQTRSNNQKLPGKKEMAELNKYLVQKDRERIENYIERKALSMTESPLGFWYEIKTDGSGRYFTDNDKIVMDYECSLLDGTTCYSSKELGPKELILGRSEMEAGLNHGLRMLKTGSEAVFILPSFLAYGFTGDGKKIPPRSVIVYNVRILNSQ